MNMNAEQKELLNNILANKEFLAEILKRATGEPMEIPALNMGDTITIAGIVWRKFKEDENGNSYMLADDVVESMGFGKNNDWRESNVRKYLADLAEEIKREIGDRLVTITTDLFSHDGLDDYGTCEDLVSVLTYDLYRNNRNTIKDIEKAFWLCTPDSTPSGCSSSCVHFVNSNGSVFCDWYDSCGGVRPFFILKS